MNSSLAPCRFARRLTAFGLALLAVAVAGCGPSRLPVAKVAGKVSLAGQPVPNAAVEFRPQQGPAASGQTDDEGRYALTTYERGDGAVIGSHTVIVVPASAGLALQPGQAPSAAPATSATAVPPRYARHDSSDLRREVASGSNEIDLNLTP